MSIMITLHPPKCYEFFVQFRVLTTPVNGRKRTWTQWEDHPDIHRPLRVTDESNHVKVMTRAARLFRKWRKLEESKTLQLRLVRKRILEVLGS